MIKVKFSFKDWTKQGKSIYDTPEGIKLVTTNFHAGTVFDGILFLLPEEETVLLEAFKDGKEAIFGTYEVCPKDDKYRNCSICAGIGMIKNNPQGVMNFLKHVFDSAKLHDKTDQELATIVNEQIWNVLPMTHITSSIISEVIDRLERSNLGPREVDNNYED